MNSNSTMTLGVLVSAMAVASTARAQSGVPTPVDGTPYVQFIDDLDNLGGYQELPNPTNEFTIPTTSSPFGQCAQVSMPFDFKYYDDTINSVRPCSHGAIGTDPNGARNFTTFNWAPGQRPSTFYDFGWIAPFWGSIYLNGNNGASFGWEIRGTAPTRYLALEYTNMSAASSTFYCCRWELDMQVKLYEGLSGKIEIDYRMVDTGLSPSYDFASNTAGMESNQGTGAINFLDSNPLASFSDVFNDLNGKRFTFVQDPGIELVALQSTAPEFAPLGAPYEVDVTVANLNVNNLGPFDVTVEVAETVEFTNAIEIGRSTLTLPQYQTRTVSVEGTAPVALGERRYYHRVCVDASDGIAEVNEDNNCVITETQTRYLPSRPDLTVDRVRIPVRTAAPGENLDVTVRVANIGSEPVTDASVAVLLSGNPAISPQDSELGRTTVSLAAGEELEIDLDVPLPTLINSGAYYIGAYVDIENTEQESNEANNGRAVDFELGIAGGDVEIITSRIPNPLVGETYSAQFTAVGGDGNYLWSIQGRPANDLPNPGLSLEAGEGLVFGVCQTPGAQTFTVNVTSQGDNASKEFTLDCVDPEEPLTIVSRSVPDGIIGQEYTFPLIVTGGASAQPDALSWSAANLPLGLDITATGVIAGTPVTPGSQVATVTVTDGTETDEQQITVNIRDNQNLLIDVAPLPTAILGEEYNAAVEASGGVGQIIFSQDGGNLPRGLVLNPDGTLTGVPDQVGTFEFVVRAQDNPPTGLRAQDRNTFVIQVVDESGDFRIATEELPVGVIDQAYNAAIAAAGGVAPITWTFEGTLPQGLETVTSEGSEELILTGTPEATDTGRFIVVTAVDALDRMAQKVLVIAVVEEGQDVPQCPDPSDERCDQASIGDDDGGGCVAVSGGSSSAFAGFLLALGFIALRRRRRA